MAGIPSSDGVRCHPVPAAAASDSGPGAGRWPGNVILARLVGRGCASGRRLRGASPSPAEAGTRGAGRQAAQSASLARLGPDGIRAPSPREVLAIPGRWASAHQRARPRGFHGFPSCRGGGVTRGGRPGGGVPALGASGRVPGICPWMGCRTPPGSQQRSPAERSDTYDVGIPPGSGGAGLNAAGDRQRSGALLELPDHGFPAAARRHGQVRKESRSTGSSAVHPR